MKPEYKVYKKQNEQSSESANRFLDEQSLFKHPSKSELSQSKETLRIITDHHFVTKNEERTGFFKIDDFRADDRSDRQPEANCSRNCERRIPKRIIKNWPDTKKDEHQTEKRRGLRFFGVRICGTVSNDLRSVRICCYVILNVIKFTFTVGTIIYVFDGLWTRLLYEMIDD